MCLYYMLEEGSQMPQLKQMVFMSLSVQHFLHHRVGGMMGAEFSALSQSSDAAPDTAPGSLAPDVDGSEGSILLGVQLFFTVPDSFFQVSVSRLLLWDLLWSHSSPRDCRGIAAGAVWSSVVYSKTLPCLSPWWYTCEEDLIRNQLINATILRQCYQHTLLCEGACKHIPYDIYILAIWRIYWKISCSTFRILPVYKITLTTLNPLPTLVAPQKHSETLLVGK